VPISIAKKLPSQCQTNHTEVYAYATIKQMKLGRADLNIRGYSLIKIIIAIVIVGLILGIVFVLKAGDSRERNYYNQTISELNTIASGVTSFEALSNQYPAEVERNLPSEIKDSLQSQYLDSWPKAPYPDAVYDYENWPSDDNGPNHTYQISVRFCPAGDDALCQSNAKKHLKKYVPKATLNNWDSYSSMYYCIKGSCRSHQSKSMNHPGYCVNCGQASKVF